jgi:fucose permease
VAKLKADMKTVVFAVVGGVVITLLTGLIDHTPEMLVGAVYYGYPFAWLEMLVVAPEYFPWVVRPLRLVLDIVVWIIVVWIIFFIVSKVRKK